MNVHHLELFYYVARHGGIMPAVRNIPYGIQQPAVSAQVAQLEEFLGVTLFHRRPFALTPPGEKLFAFVKPFFANLDKIADELQGGQARHFRLGASTIVLRDHVPKLLQCLRKKFPSLKVSLREGYPAQLEELLVKDEVDLIITLIERPAPAGLRAQVLLELPLILLVEKSSPLTAAEELWASDKINEPLICLPLHEWVTKTFLDRLTELEVEWFPAVEASSVDLIENYVANGLGIGVSVQLPHKAPPKKVRALPLHGFPAAVIGAVWRGKKTPWWTLFWTWQDNGRAKWFEWRPFFGEPRPITGQERLKFGQKRAQFLFSVKPFALARQLLKVPVGEQIGKICTLQKLQLAFTTNKYIRNAHGFATAIPERCLPEKARPNDRG